MNYIEVAVSRERKPDIVSKLIMWFTKANYSHILIIKDSVVYHAVGQGTCSVSLTDFLVKRELVQIQKVRLKVDEEFFMGYVTGADGKDYSESQYIGFLFRPLQRFVRNKKERTICSEYAARILNICCGYDFEGADFLSPKDVMTVVLDVERKGKARRELAA